MGDLINDNGATGFYAACFAGNLHVVQFLLQQGFQGINKRLHAFGSMSPLNLLINKRNHYCSHELFMPCILLLIEAGAELDENYVFEELISPVKNRIIEITFMKKQFFKNGLEELHKQLLILPWSLSRTRAAYKICPNFWKICTIFWIKVLTVQKLLKNVFEFFFVPAIFIFEIKR